jgi:biotin transport system substrate-specific component
LDRSFYSNLLSMLLGNICIYFIGVPVLAHFYGWHVAFSEGVVPFLLGDSIKILAATLLVPLYWKITAVIHNYRRRTNPPTFREYFRHCY